MATKPNKVVFPGDMFSQDQIVYLGLTPATINKTPLILLRFTRIVYITGQTFDHAKPPVPIGTFQTELYHPEIHVVVHYLSSPHPIPVNIFGKTFIIKIRNLLEQYITIVKEIESEDT